MVRARIAVLASGSGSNLQALLAHLDTLGTRRAGDVVLVASDRVAAGALGRAHERQIEARVLTDPSDGAALLEGLRARGVDLVVLAGYLKLVPPEVTRAFRGAMLNIHPALLPAFGGAGMYGARVHRAVKASGARVSGATVHFVDDAYDRGPIVAQWPVPVFAEDDADAIAARVLRVEHLLYPRAVDAVAAGRVTLGDEGTVRGAFTAERLAPFGADFRLDDVPRFLAGQIDRALHAGT